MVIGMAAIQVGRICIKKTGRDAGKKCVITKVVDENFVQAKVTGAKKARKVSIRHLEPTSTVVSVTE
jgi:large subunit ribosomal protein L14e